MHPYSGAYPRAYPDLMINPAPAKYCNRYQWLLLLMLLLTLRGTATPTRPEEELPNLGTPRSSASFPAAREQQAAQLLQQSAELLTASQPQQQAAVLAVNKAHSLASQQGERWLSQFGRARVTLGSNHRFKQFQGEAALLLPLDESCTRPLTFGQFGVNYYDSQPVINLGLGQRHLMNEWLFGYNAFLDQHLKRPHSRLGIGAELWRDYLKFSGNGYFAVSGWKDSKKVEGYQEKVVSGFDLRLQSYWPSYPQLGGQLLLENYFGDRVALFGKQRDDWQNNPLAATIGLHYTPVPLFTVAVDHKIGSKNKKETRFSLQFDYLLDLPWEQHIDPHKVAVQRTLAFSRYDWVQRNNRLVLQYRQLAPISLTLPPADQLVGFPEETIPLEATVEARFGFKEIHWDSETLTAAGGRIESLGETRYQVILPKKPGRYPLTGIAVDQQGNQSTAATTEVTAREWITLEAPAQITGKPGGTVNLPVKVILKHGFKEIKWEATEFKSDGGDLGILPGKEDQAWTLYLPKHEKTYEITGIAYDQKGNASTPAAVQIIVKKETTDPELKIQGPEKLPTTWLDEETITVTAEGGDGSYTWKSSDETLASVKDKGDGKCEVTIHKPGAVTISVESGDVTAEYKELEVGKSLLKAIDDTSRNYKDAERSCPSGSSLPTRGTIEDFKSSPILKKKLEDWARETFKPGEDEDLTIWLLKKPTRANRAKTDSPSINLVTGDYQGSTDPANLYFVLCQFDP